MRIGYFAAKDFHNKMWIMWIMWKENSNKIICNQDKCRKTHKIKDFELTAYTLM